MRILIYADLLCNTGFAHVAHNIIKQLRKDGHTFVGVGINYRGDPAAIFYPEFADIPVFPTNVNDPLGKKRMINCMEQLEYDAIFVIGDLFNLDFMIEPLKVAHSKGKKSVLYFPVDASIKKEWVETIKAFNVAITYTQFAHDECKKFGLDIPFIYHGYDDTIYYPRNKSEMRAKWFADIPSDARLFLNVNVNQPRKDLPSTIDAFALYNKINNNSYLYMHCIANDPRGINLEYYINHYYPELLNNIIFPEAKDIINQTYTDNMMAEIYSACDLTISTTLGEGWGLSATESLACGTPILMPAHTSLCEIVEHFGGGLYKTNGYRVNANDNSWQRPVPHVEHLALNMNNEYEIIDEALKEITWDKIGLKWREIINKL